VEVTPAISLPPGTFEHDVDVIGVLTDGTRLPPVPLHVSGVVEPDIHALPGAVRFGVRTVGERAQATVVLEAHSGKDFRIIRTTMSGSSLTVTPSDSPLSARHRLTIANDTFEPGQHHETVRLEVAAADGEPSACDVPVQWYGTR
jgi:hypothetical protein